MKTANKKNSSIVFLVFAVSVLFSGCDMIDSIKAYFKKPETAKLVVQSSTQNIVTPPIAATTEKKDIPLKENEIAKINDWVITLEDFNERLKALKEVVPEYDIEDLGSKKLVLEELLRQQLLVIDAEQRGIDKQKDIAAAIEEFKRTILVREVARSITESVVVEESELLDIYEKRKDELVEPIEYRVSAIVVKDQITANELLVKILKGENFATIAKENSIGKSAGNGGDIGFLQKMPNEEMQVIVETLTVGDVSSVFKGPEGYYIVKIEDKRGGNPLSFEDIKENLEKNVLRYKQQQALLQYLQKMQEQVDIKINQDLLK